MYLENLIQFNYAQTIDFINFLKKCNKTENPVYYISAFFRKKYVDRESSYPSNLKLADLLIKPYYNNKVINIKLKQLVKYVEIRIIEECLPVRGVSFYITVNPRDMKRALKNFLKEIIEHIEDTSRILRFEKRAISIIHSSAMNKYFKMIDIDFKKEYANIDLSEGVKNFKNLGFENVILVHTKNGKHLIFSINNNNFKDKNILKNLFTNTQKFIIKTLNLNSNIVEEIKLENDPMTVLYQGGYIPKIDYY